jgi:predicted porin
LTVRWVTETIKDSSAKKIKIGEGDAKYEFLPATAGQVADRKNDALGATYDFGLAKLFFVDAKTKQGTAATEVSLNTQTVGVRVPFGAYTFVAKTGTGKAKLTDSTVKADVDAYQLLVMYALAKDTTLYAAYGAESISHSSFTNKKFEQTNAQLGLRYRF